MNKFSIMLTNATITTIGLLGSVAYADNQWTGFYTGVDAGLAFNHAYLKSQQLGFTDLSNNCNTFSDFTNFSPGIQFGYMYQFSNFFVSGIEANVIFDTNQKETFRCNSDLTANVYDRFTFRSQMQTSLKGRVGRTLNWDTSTVLPYLVAGASFIDVGLTYDNEGGDHYSHSKTQAGWLMGAGIEWAFKQHWSLRAEYSYIDYGTAISLKLPSVYSLVDPDGKARVDLNTENIVVSLNYWVPI